MTATRAGSLPERAGSSWRLASNAWGRLAMSSPMVEGVSRSPSRTCRERPVFHRPREATRPSVWTAASARQIERRGDDADRLATAQDRRAGEPLQPLELITVEHAEEGEGPGQ